MQRFIGGCLMVVAVLACVAGFGFMTLTTSAISQVLNTTAEQGVSGQYEAIGGVVASALGLGAGLLTVLGGSLIAWVLGVAGYAMYPMSTPESPLARKLVDLLAVVTGAFLALAMALAVIGLAASFFNPRPGGLSMNGPTFLLGLALTLALLLLGGMAAVRGVRNLAGPASQPAPAALSSPSAEPPSPVAAPVPPQAPAVDAPAGDGIGADEGESSEVDETPDDEPPARDDGEARGGESPDADERPDQEPGQ